MINNLDHEEADPLCCCEYKNVHGDRAHLCGLLCDCAELDDAFDKAFKGLKIPEQRGGQILEVIEDRLRLPWPRGAIKVPMDKVSPWLLVPLLFKIASQSWLSQVLVHGSVLPAVVFSKYKMCLRGYRPHTKFFASWSLATFTTLIYIYQIHVVGFISLPKTISFWENLVAMCKYSKFPLFYRKKPFKKYRECSHREKAFFLEKSLVFYIANLFWSFFGGLMIQLVLIVIFGKPL